jgi:ribosomal protein S18 acetylase RimI-like enzyme
VNAELRIGPVGIEHAGELFTVQRAAYVTEARRYGTVEIPPLNETLAEAEKEIADPDVLVLGAWLGARLVGSVRGRPEGVGPRQGVGDDTADALMEIARFAVAPDVQGRGVGRDLLAAIEAATPAQVETLWLVTGSLSESNVRFYQRSGYRVTGSMLDAVGIEILRMQKLRIGNLPNR